MAATAHDGPASAFGHWDVEHGLPVFRETAHPDDPACRWDPVVAPATNRHWCAVGNRRLRLVAENLGTTAVWDTAQGLRWLTAAEPGTGATIVTGGAPDRPAWGTDRGRWPESWTGEATPVRTWGPTWFTVSGAHDGLRIARTVGCPEGDLPWLLVRVTLTSGHPPDGPPTDPIGGPIGGSPGGPHGDPAGAGSGGRDRRVVEVGEEWRIAPHGPAWDAAADRVLTSARDQRGVTLTAPGLVVRVGADRPLDRVEVEGDGGPAPTVRLVHRVSLAAGEPAVLWFLLGLLDEQPPPDDPAGCWEASLTALGRRLPAARCDRVPPLAREVPWHVALLTGGAAVDAVLGGHTLDQGSAYSFHWGFTGAARDSLQHALPLVHCEPDLALSVLRNTCAWAGPDGELPYALTGVKQPLTTWFQPSDQALWSLWLAAEYAAATGDLAAFRQPAGYHPVHRAAPAPLVDHLVGQFRHLVDVVGTGAHGHVRIRNADWNDAALAVPGTDRARMQQEGESVLNSAMAAWVLPRFAGLLRRLGGADLAEVADEADRRADRWRALVADEWTGRWYRRARGPGVTVGEDDLWLEVQPWAILCGAADADRARVLLATVDDVLRQGSPLGARLRGPVPVTPSEGRVSGEGPNGGVWFSISMTLAWAASRVEPELAWDELARMTLAAHTAAYPSTWEGTLSGPDAYNAPESPRPGQASTLPHAIAGMQSFPVSNLHSHAQVVLAYLRILGVEPAADGSLHVDGHQGSFASPVLELTGDGHGRLRAAGAVRVVTPAGTVDGDRGWVGW